LNALVKSDFWRVFLIPPPRKRGEGA